MSRTHLVRRGVAPLFAAAAVLGLSSESQAQTRTVEVSARGGTAIPVGSLGQVTDLGYVFGAGLAYPLGRRVRLRTDVEFLFHPGVEHERRGVDVDQWFFFLGADVDLGPRESPLGIRAEFGTGLSLLGSDPLSQPVGRRFLQLHEEQFAWHAGLEARYEVTDSFTPYLRARGLYTYAGNDVALFRMVDEDVGEGGLFVSIPLEVGVSLSF